MLGVVALMLLGTLALTVWIFRVVIESTRGLIQTMSASPAGPLQELGLSVTSDVAGGVGQGSWKGTPVRVLWSMTSGPATGEATPPPEFSTSVVTSFTRPLALGITFNEERGAPACGIDEFDGQVRLSGPPSPQTQALLKRWAPQIHEALHAPGRLQITDSHVALTFDEIVDDKQRLIDALDKLSALQEVLLQAG